MNTEPKIEARCDDEHGLVRPWIALLDGAVLRDKRGAIRTFATERAALAAAKRGEKA
jgi:hypothetical protein